MDERERAAQLGRAWDSFKRTDFAWCDPDDLAVVRSLIALDRQPAPDPSFVATLEGALLRPRPVRPLPILSWPIDQAAGSSVDAGDIQAVPGWGHRPWLTRRAAAAIAILMCGALAFLTLQTGSNNGGNPSSLPAYGDASSAALTWQETPECDVPARPSGSFQTLFAMSAGDMTPTPPPDEVGTAANIATVAAIEALVRELVACHNAEQPGRFYALWTNTAILWTNRIMSEPKGSSSWLQSVWQAAEAAEAADGTPEPGEPVEIWTVQGVDDITVLSNGRVRATVRYGTPRGEFAVLTHFDQRDGQFLLDAAAGWTYGGSAEQYPWTNLLATPDSVPETGSRMTTGDSGAAVRTGGLVHEDPFWSIGTGDASSIGQDLVVPIESTNPGDTSAGNSIGGSGYGPIPAEPTPRPTENVNPTSTFGRSAVGGAAVGGTASGGYVTVRPTPNSADD